MIRESRYIAILQAAQCEDPDMCGGFDNDEEKQEYEDLLKWFEERRAELGDAFDDMEIDIPYSYEDADDYDEEAEAEARAAWERERRRVQELIDKGKNDNDDEGDDDLDKEFLE